MIGEKKQENDIPWSQTRDDVHVSSVTKTWLSTRAPPSTQYRWQSSSSSRTERYISRTVTTATVPTCYLLFLFDNTRIQTISMNKAIIIREVLFHLCYWYPPWKRLSGPRSFLSWNWVGPRHFFLLGLRLPQEIKPWLKNLGTGCLIQIVWLFSSPHSPIYCPS